MPSFWLCNKILNLNPESNINLIQIWKNKKIGNQKLEKREKEFTYHLCRFLTLAQLSPRVSAPAWAVDRPIARLAFALVHGWHRWSKPEMRFRWWCAHHTCGAPDLRTPPVRFIFDLTVNNGGCLGFTWRDRCTSDLDSKCMNCFPRVAAAVWDLPQPHRAPYEQQIGSKLFPLPPAQSRGRNNMGGMSRRGYKTSS
jgi:hypothetical protein